MAAQGRQAPEPEEEEDPGGQREQVLEVTAEAPSYMISICKEQAVTA